MQVITDFFTSLSNVFQRFLEILEEIKNKFFESEE